MQITPQELTSLLTWAIETVEPNTPDAPTAPEVTPERTIGPVELAEIFRAYVTITPGCASPNKIAAIREVRRFTGIALKEAKDVVEGCYRP